MVSEQNQRARQCSHIFCKRERERERERERKAGREHIVRKINSPARFRKTIDFVIVAPVKAANAVERA